MITEYTGLAAQAIEKEQILESLKYLRAFWSSVEVRYYFIY